jgi:hypothetical protein
MRMKLTYMLVLLAFVIAQPQAEAQLLWWKKKDKTEKKAPPKKDKGKVKPYKKVITEDADSDEGLFTVHKVKDKNYFEISNDLLDKEILVVSRIAGFVKGLNFGGAGTKSRPQQVIRWQKKDDQILLRSVSYNSVASFEDPIYKSVKNNNFEPVIMIFDVKAYGPDSNSVVIDVDPLFTTDVNMIGAMYDSQRKQFGIKGLDSKRSFINYMKSFPENTEVRHVLTYRGSKLPDNQLTGTMSVEMNQSFILLPEDPMEPRHFDARVGYFSISQTDYSSEKQKAAKNRFITRWKLVPKDIEAYKRGELVEPVKPIVYYIDPATPTQWVPYLKQGVNDWNSAFEKAGFKNAIMAKEAPSPEEDPDWSAEDVRYSVIRYVSTDIQNAMGPHVHDPRTGEIIESDIIWYHNVMNLLRNWFFIQTAAINPDAQKVQFDNEVMGRLIRFVSAHEVGHTLGLPHNMGSSVAYPVDSLRSPSFTKRMGTAPSIMDYARFNYVAQPEDGDVALMPDIGVYDKWSIEWGYRYFPDASPEEKKKTLAGMILEHKDDPYYRFGRQRGLPLDPTAQTEDLGDDSMHASEMGIKNLKRILPNLIEWTAEEGKDFEDLEELYGQVLGQFRRYMGHVTANIGGVYEYFKTYDEDEPIYTHVPKEKQQRAVAFLDKHLFQTPEWMINKEILGRIEEKGNNERIRGLQERTLRLILNPDRLSRMIENEALNGEEAYSVTELFGDMNAAIFKELEEDSPIDMYRRNLQRTYIERMKALMEIEQNEYEHSDIMAIARGNLNSLKKRIEEMEKAEDMTAYHLQDLSVRIEEILTPNTKG